MGLDLSGQRSLLDALELRNYVELDPRLDYHVLIPYRCLSVHLSLSLARDLLVRESPRSLGEGAAAQHSKTRQKIHVGGGVGQSRGLFWFFDLLGYTL